MFKSSVLSKISTIFKIKKPYQFIENNAFLHFSHPLNSDLSGYPLN